MTDLASRIDTVRALNADHGGALGMAKFYVIRLAEGRADGRFVCRRHCLLTDGRMTVDPTLFCVGETIEEVRRKIPRGLECIDRGPGDDPGIAEVWV